MLIHQACAVRIISPLHVPPGLAVSVVAGKDIAAALRVVAWLGADWSVVEQPTRGEHSVERIEALYLNPIVVAELKRERQLELLGEVVLA